MATLLVQQGTLKRGRHRPVRVDLRPRPGHVRRPGPADRRRPARAPRSGSPGSSEVPNADDPFYVVDELATAREIAETRGRTGAGGGAATGSPRSAWSRSRAAKPKIKITELKVILKAEARGSVEAIRKELEKLVHEEVRTRVLHAGIGAITESDVQLALTSPDDTLVVGFNVTADDAALRLAEERGITRSASTTSSTTWWTTSRRRSRAGSSRSRRSSTSAGRSSGETFKICKVGHHRRVLRHQRRRSSGSARVRVIREGVVVFPPAEKVVGLDSLKRFKDDAKDVREGFECGMKIAGFDDVKVGDVIEAFKIEIAAADAVTPTPVRDASQERVRPTRSCEASRTAKRHMVVGSLRARLLRPREPDAEGQAAGGAVRAGPGAGRVQRVGRRGGRARRREGRRARVRRRRRPRRPSCNACSSRSRRPSAATRWPSTSAARCVV